MINLQGHKLTLNHDGVEVRENTTASTIYSGIVTSSSSFVNIHSLGTSRKTPGNLYMDSTIADSTHSVGVRFSRGYGILVFEGYQSNTFTGNVEVDGRGNSLYLNKFNGAVAIQGNAFINQGHLVFHRNQQLSKKSKVTLKNNATLSYIPLSSYSISNTFNKLSIENSGTINFNHKIENSSVYNPSNYYIYLNDLIINRGGHLKVQDWQDGRDFILVRKTSENLADALTKMEFEGYDRNNIHLRDYDSDYWQISALPEPTTYGAILSAVGGGVWTWRRRKRHPSNPRS